MFVLSREVTVGMGCSLSGLLVGGRAQKDQSRRRCSTSPAPIKSNLVRGEPPGSLVALLGRAGRTGGGTGRAGLDRARLAGRAPAQVAAVLTGTAAIIGSRAR